MKKSHRRTSARFGTTLKGMAQAVRLNAVLSKAVYRNCLAPARTARLGYDASIQVAQIEPNPPNHRHSNVREPGTTGYVF